MLAGIFLFFVLGMILLAALHAAEHHKEPEHVDPKVHDLWYREIWCVGAPDVYVAKQLSAVLTPAKEITYEPQKVTHSVAPAVDFIQQAQ